MYKNVQVNHYNNATSTTTSSSLPSHTNQNVTSLPVQITSVFSSSSSSTSPLHNSNICDSGISLPVAHTTSNKIMSSSKLKSDVDQLDDLVKDLLNEVNRPLNPTNENSVHRYSYQRNLNNDLSNLKVSSSSLSNHGKRSDIDTSTTSAPRTKTIREERIRIKRGTPNTDVPPTAATTTTTTTTTTTGKSQIPPSSIDEHLIDSLLESVQNTLKKRAQKNQSNTIPDVPVQNRRTYSSSAAYTDSIHRVSLS